MPKKKTNNPDEDFSKPGHYAGAISTGYTLREDGVYEIAPIDQNRIELILSEIRGLDHLVGEIHKFATQRYAHIENQRERWFSDMRKNLRLPEGLAFSYLDGRVTLAIEEKAQKNKKP